MDPRLDLTCFALLSLMVSPSTVWIGKSSRRRIEQWGGLATKEQSKEVGLSCGVKDMECVDYTSVERELVKVCDPGSRNASKGEPE